MYVCAIETASALFITYVTTRCCIPLAPSRSCASTILSRLCHGQTKYRRSSSLVLLKGALSVNIADSKTPHLPASVQWGVSRCVWTLSFFHSRENGPIHHSEFVSLRPNGGKDAIPISRWYSASLSRWTSAGTSVQRANRACHRVSFLREPCAFQPIIPYSDRGRHASRSTYDRQSSLKQRWSHKRPVC